MQNNVHKTKFTDVRSRIADVDRFQEDETIYIRSRMEDEEDPGGTQEAPMRHQEAPGGTQEARDGSA